MMERRLEDRFLCADLVKVAWRDREDEFRTIEAVLEDISTQGACVQVEERIPLGTTISISPDTAPGSPEDGRRFSGHVSYCAYRDYGYFVGIRFLDETQWSRKIFIPQHLTNLAALADREGQAPDGELISAGMKEI